jgi:predicted Zn-dependent protease
LLSEDGKALVYLERALKATPGGGQLYVQLAQAYALQGDFVTANQYMQQALSSDTANPEVQQLADYIKQQF